MAVRPLYSNTIHFLELSLMEERILHDFIYLNYEGPSLIALSRCANRDLSVTNTNDYSNFHYF